MAVTVKEAMEKLKKFPSNAPIIIVSPEFENIGFPCLHICLEEYDNEAKDKEVMFMGW